MKTGEVIPTPRGEPAGEGLAGARITRWLRPSLLSARVWAAWERRGAMLGLVGLDSRGFAWLVSNAVEDGPYSSLAELLRVYELAEEDLTPAGPSR
jgi:hypothetical protein